MWHFDVILGLLFFFFFFLKKTSLFFLESTEPLCRQISSLLQDGRSSSRSLLVVAKALCRRISVAVAVLPFRQPNKSSTSAVLPFTGRYPLSRALVAAVHGLQEWTRLGSEAPPRVGCQPDPLCPLPSLFHQREWQMRMTGPAR
jgi:hypothetical protein